MFSSIMRPMMPIQEMLTGVTFPSPTMNVNTIPTPAQLFGSALRLWLKGDVGVTNDGSGNANLWADQSGLLRNLAPASGTLDPLIVASAQNGLAGLQSTNATSTTSPFLVTPYIAELDFLATTPFCVAMAYKPAPVPSGTVYGGEIGNMAYTLTPGTGWLLGNLNNTAIKPTLRLINTKATAECSASTSVALTSGTAYIIHAVNTGTGTAAGLKIYVNGVLQTMTTVFDTLAGASTQNSTRGVASPAVGTSGAYGISRATVLEQYIVNRLPTAVEIAISDAYLNARYAIH